VLSRAACTGKPVGVGEKVCVGVCDGVTVCEGDRLEWSDGEQIRFKPVSATPRYGSTAVHVKPLLADAHEP